MDARELLEKYKRERKEYLEKIREIGVTIRRMEADLGEVHETLEDADQIEDQNPEFKLDQTCGAIKPDEFFGMTQSNAAKKHLEKVGRAVSIDQLVEVLRKGGCKIGGADPKRTLYIALVRNNRDFIPPQAGYIGLRKFYPQLKKK